LILLIFGVHSGPVKYTEIAINEQIGASRGPGQIRVDRVAGFSPCRFTDYGHLAIGL
jgi:hypothetical protein